MKIRTDFVTNSSSSSFILAFHDEHSIGQELLDDNTQGELEQILRDVMHCKEEYSKEEIISEYREYVEDMAHFRASDYIKRKKGLSWVESYDYVKNHPDEINALVSDIVKEQMEELEEKIKGMEVVVMIEYEDHTEQGSRLEHEIVPYMFSCKAIMNNH